MKNIVFHALSVFLISLSLQAETLAVRVGTTLQVYQDGVFIREIYGVNRQYDVGVGIIAYLEDGKKLTVATESTGFMPVRVADNVDSFEITGLNVFFRVNNSLYVATNCASPYQYALISNSMRDYKVAERIGRIAPISVPQE